MQKQERNYHKIKSFYKYQKRIGCLIKEHLNDMIVEEVGMSTGNIQIIERSVSEMKIITR